MTDIMNNQAELSSLSSWLGYLEKCHPSEIELGLDRVAAVYKRLKLDFSHSKILLVGGTNGKGTSCRLLQAILSKKGFCNGAYNSPHLFDYKERINIDGRLLSEKAHCLAFQQVEQARYDGEPIALTFFEMGTLAALVLLSQSKLDYIILEVGLGGRLDATNVVEPSASLITTIALDHQDWLGTTRESIAYEKSGIMRADKLTVCGDLEPPVTVVECAEKLGTKLILAQGDYQWTEQATSWSWQMSGCSHTELHKPAMPIQNASAVLALLTSLGLQLHSDELNDVFREFSLAGRWQNLSKGKGLPCVIYDVGHNPQASAYLRQQIEAKLDKGTRCYVVAGMLKDKSIADTFIELAGIFEHWYLADVEGERGANSADLADAVPNITKKESYSCHSSAALALEAAIAQANQDDFILVFGSFWIASAIKSVIEQY